MFDNLKPEDFARTTSATGEHPHIASMRDLGLTAGPMGFNVFVDLLLEKCRKQAGRDEDFIPFAVLHGTDFQRYFEGEDDEVPMDFAHRLHREAQQMQATWMFVAMIAPARAIYKDDDPPPPIDDSNTEAIQEAVFSGDLDLCVCWSASRVEGVERANRAGIMYIDNEGSVGQEIEAPLNPETDPFRGVLA